MNERCRFHTNIFSVTIIRFTDIQPAYFDLQLFDPLSNVPTVLVPELYRSYISLLNFSCGFSSSFTVSTGLFLLRMFG